MPNIPNVPGVPALSSYGSNNLSLLAADVAAVIGFFSTQQWGIFLDGVSVIDADNVVSFSHKQDFPISDYTVEQGGFQTYNKVTLPGDIRMRFSAGGSILNRQAFLASIDDVMNTTDLYQVLTPEGAYLDYNFTHRDMHDRTNDDGAGMITIDLWLVEVRQSATSSFSNTQQPGNAGRQNSGNVQTQTPDDGTKSAIESGLQF